MPPTLRGGVWRVEVVVVVLSPHVEWVFMEPMSAHGRSIGAHAVTKGANGRPLGLQEGPMGCPWRSKWRPREPMGTQGALGSFSFIFTTVIFRKSNYRREGKQKGEDPPLQDPPQDPPHHLPPGPPPRSARGKGREGASLLTTT